MNMFNWIVALTFGVTLLGGYVMLVVHSVKQQRRVQALENQVQMFADASISVAQSLDRLLQQGDMSQSANVSSRRWLLQEAKSRIQRGESVHSLSQTLGLSKDEVRLLTAHLH